MEHIDMEKIAELIRRAGYVAYVQQTGGGVATIYASRTANEHGFPHEIDADGHVEAIAGPGWFEGQSWTQPRAALDDFYVGPDDDGVAEPYAATAADDEASLAAKMIATMTGEATYHERAQ